MPVWTGWKGPKTQAVEEMNRTLADVLREIRLITAEVRTIAKELEST